MRFMRMEILETMPMTVYEAVRSVSAGQEPGLRLGRLALAHVVKAKNKDDSDGGERDKWPM